MAADQSAQSVLDIEDECHTCGEGLSDPIDRCPQSQRPCGHHCNHVWLHDSCDWCGGFFDDDAEWHQPQNEG